MKEDIDNPQTNGVPVLFIGGPWDGQPRNMDERNLSPRYTVPVFDSSSIAAFSPSPSQVPLHVPYRHEHYRLEYIADPLGTFWLYVHESLPAGQARGFLINTYINAHSKPADVLAGGRGVGDERAELERLHKQVKDQEKIIADGFEGAMTAMVKAGWVRVELCGHMEHAEHIKGFFLDKTKYKMRIVDETEESARVIIESVDEFHA